MTKRALIAEPDQEEALRQAAILKDDGFETLVFTGGDLVAALEQSPPDVLVLRHERQGGQTGLAMVPRIKAVSSITSIILTTSELTSDAIDKNKKQRVHADWYLRLPADRSELVAAARAVPSTHSTNVQSATVAPETRDPGRPPPLPPAGLRALGQLARVGPRGTGDAVLTAEDLTFVEKVFSSIQHVDADAPINEPAPSAIGDTPDRKLALLRTKLKERERDLAKLSRLWRAREEDLRQQEARVQQKDIEIEGLRLRISELTADLEAANATLVDKETEWGRQIGETYEQHSLNEAELIQAVAGKEAELNRQKTALRKLEDQLASERKDFTSRILEWEKAYADFEQHHWKVVMGSVDEVMRLETQIRERELGRSEARSALRDRDNTIVVLQSKNQHLLTNLFEVECAAAVKEERTVVAVQSAMALERRQRRAAEGELVNLREQLFFLEQDLRRHQVVLSRTEDARHRQLAEMATVIRSSEAEIVRLGDERHHYRTHAAQLEAALSTATALGEAVAATLFAMDDKKSLVFREQTQVRDRAIDDLRDDKQRLEGSVSDLTARLGQEEMDHAAENARAEELEKDLADTRERLASTETRLQGALDGMTAERDRLVDRVATTEQQLATTRDDLSGEKHSRQQRELEVANVLERKDAELSDRTSRIADLERGLTDAKEDLVNLRKTVSTRDDRITELLNRVRDADEKQVQLEGQLYRLEAANNEKEANLIARDERIASLADKLGQREDRIEAIEVDLRKAQSTILDRQAHIDRQDANMEELRRHVSAAKEDAASTRGDLQARSNELFEAERKASTLLAELQNARADVAAGGVIAEQLQSQLALLDARASDLRGTLEETDAKLRATLVDLEAEGQRSDHLRTELADARDNITRRDSDLAEKSRFVAEIEKARDQLQVTLTTTRQMLEQQLAGLEVDKAEVEEQLAVQTGENGALSASLSDASGRIEELMTRVRTLEATMGEREGRIVAQDQILEKAGQTTDEQRRMLAEKESELVELRHAFEDAKSAIEERARWLAIRDGTITEYKTALDSERSGRSDEQAAAQVLAGQYAEATKRAETLANEVVARDKKLSDQHAASTQSFALEREKATKASAEVDRLLGVLSEKESALLTAGAAAAQLAEAQKSGAHVRAEYQKLRAQAEKILADSKQVKAALEKADADRKGASAETDKLRAELAEVRAHATSAASQGLQAKVDAEAKTRELAEAKAVVARTQQQLEQAFKLKADAEAEAEATRQRSARELSAANETQQTEVNRLNREVLEARKAQRDAQAQALQAKAEAEQVKKTAALRLAGQRTTSLPSSTTSPPDVAAPRNPSMPPQVQGAQPTSVAPPVVAGPAHGAADAESDFDSPTVMVVAPGPAQDPFAPQSTVMVPTPFIPSLARGPDKG
jgi:chromosome segregation ATPase